jgi:hypothetical protein
MNWADKLSVAGVVLSLAGMALSLAAFWTCHSAENVSRDPLRFEKDWVKAWQRWRQGKPASEALEMLNELRLDGHISEATARRLALEAPE